MTKNSKELDLRIDARFTCSKSLSTTDLLEFTFFVKIMIYLYDAFCDTKGEDEDWEVFPFSDLVLLDMDDV